jgi:hypothetical protein
VEPQVAELLRDIALQLNLPEAGVVTPWATRKSDLDWQEISNPDTNIAMFGITDAKIQEASVVLFGQPIPFVTVFTDSPLTISDIERIAEDSNYDLFETQAVYSQADSDPIPKIQFVHWFRVKDISDQLTRSSKRMEAVAQEMRGTLLFSQQVPVGNSTIRQPPGISFEDAFDLQQQTPIEITPGNPPPSTGPFPEPTPGFPPATTQPVPAQRDSIMGPGLVGLGLLGATIVVWKVLKK